MSDKCRCSNLNCDWRGPEQEILRAPNPFDEDDTLVGCPRCLDINTLIDVCDEPGCWEFSSCGHPVPGGYQRTCGKHHVTTTTK